jgi:hypothetical protein
MLAYLFLNARQFLNHDIEMKTIHHFYLSYARVYDLFCFSNSTEIEWIAKGFRDAEQIIKGFRESECLINPWSVKIHHFRLRKCFIEY